MPVLLTSRATAHSAFHLKKGDNVTNVTFILIFLSLLTIAGFIYLTRIILDLRKRLNESTSKASENNENIANVSISEAVNTAPAKINKADKSCFYKRNDTDVKEANDYCEANIMKVNKADGIQYAPVNPNRMSLRGSEQLYKLDIVIEKPLIDKPAKNK